LRYTFPFSFALFCERLIEEEIGLEKGERKRNRSNE
tara:strand:- start:13 stop:120 length:108 start_codon:yes stop_codon:yes gene_type:complete